MIPQSGTDPAGLPVFAHLTGVAFSLVVEGQPGISGKAVGTNAFRSDGMSFPDLEVEVSRQLGDGSPAVCDQSGPTAGGVPAIDPPDFTSMQTNIDAVNDLACRFLNGAGLPGPRKRSDDPCVLFPSGDSGFVSADSTIQYCGFVDRVLEFPHGDTVVTARLVDIDGNPGPPAQIVVRVGL